MNNIKNERGDIAFDITEIQQTIRDYYEQVHTNTLDNLEGIDKFLGACNLLQLSYEEIENLNKPVMSKDTESLTKNLPIPG